MSVSRRGMLAGGAAGVGLAVTGAMPSLAEAHPKHSPAKRRSAIPFPPLQDDPKGIVALPKGFGYEIVTWAGKTKLKTGEFTPDNHDGMAAFGHGNDQYLILNHERDAEGGIGVPHVPGTVYDPAAVEMGGCTVIKVDKLGRNLGQWVGISGTVCNCAGGPTPWGSWLTCEEYALKAGETIEDTSIVVSKDHGYVFEVRADGKTAPVALKALGRYDHEAVAISADRRAIYLSEDASEPNGLFYKWAAPGGHKLGSDITKKLDDVRFGTLYALAILLPDGSVLPDVAYLTSSQIGRPFPVKWVKVPDRDAQDMATREQFADGEVTRGKKFEGVWGTDEGVYVVNSYAVSYEDTDLPADAVPHSGMVWFYEYATETIQLVNYFPFQQYVLDESTEAAYPDLNFDGPDNVTVTPWGSLVLAEDGTGASHVLSSVPGGPTQAIARNQFAIDDDGETVYSEFTGPTFSADGRVLFVNIQDPGITLAITGPWEKYLG